MILSHRKPIIPIYLTGFNFVFNWLPVNSIYLTILDSELCCAWITWIVYKSCENYVRDALIPKVDSQKQAQDYQVF